MIQCTSNTVLNFWVRNNRPTRYRLMSKTLVLVIAVCATIFGAHPSQAQQLLESYQAFLSERDHFSSSGQRLTTAAAVIRQDRANYHRFGLKDQGDENDMFFADSANRTALERLLERGRAEPGVISRIVNGTPTVRVEVWRGNSGPFVVVTLIDTTNQDAKGTNPPPPTAPSPEQKPSATVRRTIHTITLPIRDRLTPSWSCGLIRHRVWVYASWRCEMARAYRCCSAALTGGGTSG